MNSPLASPSPDNLEPLALHVVPTPTIVPAERVRRRPRFRSSFGRAMNPFRPAPVIRLVAPELPREAA